MRADDASRSDAANPSGRAVVAALVSALALLATSGACGLEVVGAGRPPESGAPTEPDGGPGGDASDGSSADGGVEPAALDGGADAARPPAAAIYVASAQSLWRLDPATHVFKNLGPLSDCTADLVGELAVDGKGALVATRRDHEELYVLTLSPLACTLLFTAAYPPALSFVPRGTLAVGEESLVGYDDETGDYERVDLTTGDRTVVTAGALGDYRPSGDLVAGGLRGYLAAAAQVGDCIGGGNTDCLLEVDLATGAVVADLGHLPEAHIYGLAYWAGRVYAFANDTGKTYVVTPSPLTVVKTLEPPVADIAWYGAGSTTAAPTE